MKFHFRHHDVGGVIVPTDHPSSLLVIDAHGLHVDDMLDSPRSMAADDEHRVGYGEHHSSPQTSGGIERDLDASRHHGECTHQKMDGSSSSVVPCQNSSNFLEVQQSNNNFHSSDDESGSPTSSSGSSSPTSKRALHLEDGECPHSQRPRSRPFFRLGRHRSRSGKKEQSASASSSSTFNDGFSSNVPLVDKRTYGTVGCFSDSSDTGEEEEEEHEMNLQQGEHRGGGVANIHCRRSKGISRLRKPLLRRTQSLPIHSIAKPQNLTDSKEEGDSIMGGSNSSFEGGLAKIVSTTSLTSTTTTADINSPTRTKEQRTHRRHVTFTSVSVRQYSTILGDHPCCPSGPPLALGWKFTEQGSMEFETYETQREPERVKSKDKLRLDGDERRGILRSLVVSTTTASSDPLFNDAQPSASSSESEGENSDAKKKDDSTTTVCLYTQRELARAERRLTRERASNNRAHQRMNRKFFRPLTAEECEIGSSSDSVSVSSSATHQEGEEGKTKINDDVGCCTSPSPMKVIDEPLEENRMDISPVNLRMTFASSDRMSFDEADESSI